MAKVISVSFKLGKFRLMIMIFVNQAMYDLIGETDRKGKIWEVFLKNEKRENFVYR